MIDFRLPSLGADMDEGTLLQWKVAPGARVARGQVVAIVDTSKAAVDLEIWTPGIVAELLVEPGSKVPVGTVLARLAEVTAEPADTPANALANAPAAAPPGAAAATQSPRAPAPVATPNAMPSAIPSAMPTTAMPTTATHTTTTREAAPTVAPSRQPDARALLAAARHPVSPAARRRARELAIDPETVAGTGPHASVTIADVERAARERALRAPAAAGHATGPARPADAVAAAAPSPAASAGPFAASAPPATPSVAPLADRQPEMRKAIAAAMARSKREIPHYYLSETIPMAAALQWLRQRNESLPITARVLPAALLLKGVALALRRRPGLNGFFRDGRFEPAAQAHIGIAISLRGGGLVAPAIHDVGDKPLDRLMLELSDLVRRARAGSLRSSEMSDPTITVTNLGDQGVESVHGVIYPPQVALVGFGRIAERPWAQDGWIRAMPLVTATLAADHRVSDGHAGALFLAELRELLQQPEALAGTPPTEQVA